MKKIILSIMMVLLTITGCSSKTSINNKEIIQEEINWYIELDKNNDYIKCDNKEKNIDNGTCYIGTYGILNGNLEGTVSISFSLDHYYKDGGLFIVDSSLHNINLERIEKYKKNIVSIEKETNEVYLITIVDQVDYYID